MEQMAKWRNDEMAIYFSFQKGKRNVCLKCPKFTKTEFQNPIEACTKTFHSTISPFRVLNTPPSVVQISHSALTWKSSPCKDEVLFEPDAVCDGKATGKLCPTMCGGHTWMTHCRRHESLFYQRMKGRQNQMREQLTSHGSIRQGKPSIVNHATVYCG